MEKRVEIFSFTSIDEFQDDINKFLQRTGGEIHDIKFCTHVDPHTDEVFNAMLIYTPTNDYTIY